MFLNRAAVASRRVGGSELPTDRVTVSSRVSFEFSPSSPGNYPFHAIRERSGEMQKERERDTIRGRDDYSSHPRYIRNVHCGIVVAGIAADVFDDDRYIPYIRQEREREVCNIILNYTRDIILN